ncbi:MAG TPA: ribonuclease activity regulator RraA [Stellaceae bacterium]|nr:ribonuclease activity regulator RraA [Stellaceae bacterium]
MDTAISDDIKALLRKCSVATLSTQLFKRGLRQTVMQGVRPLSQGPEPMVGEAFTLRFIPAREDLDHVGVFADPNHPQRKAIETVPPGHVLVCDCRGDARAASGGSILLTRLKVRGVAGFVSDGGLRDSPEIAELGFPVYFGGPAPMLNLARHHAVDLNQPIGCGGVAVFPGDVLVGDGEGVIVIPRHLAKEVAHDAAEQERLEQFVIEEVRKGAPVIGTYPPKEAALARYQEWLKRQPKG